MKRVAGSRGFWCVAFGLGLLVSSWCPARLLIIIMSLMIVVLGCSRCR